MSDKELALQTLQRLPDTISLSEIGDELALLAALREGEKQADEGRTRPHEQVKDLLRQCTSR
jgi:predicted transcriptional regulator